MFLFGIFFSNNTFAQLPDDNEYVYVTMDLQGVLELTMTTDPNIGFVFSNIQQYQSGIINANATQLRVESTVGWDLYCNSETSTWDVLQTYTTSGTSTVPDSLLEVKVIDAAGNSALSTFTKMQNTRLDIIGTTTASDGNAAGTYLTAPTTHQFRVDYRIIPTLASNFRSGYYGLSVVYTLTEDL